MNDYRLDPDGPHSDDYTRHVAQAFAESVRVLNYATRDQDGVPHPATVNAVLGELRTGMQRMDQLLLQVGDRLVRLSLAGRLADTRGDAARAHAEAQRQIELLRTDAAVMAERLNRAFRATSGLYLRNGGQ